MRVVEGGVPTLRGRMGYLRDRILDGVDLMLGRSSWDSPPRRLNFVGGPNFSAPGDRYLQFFVDVCGLLPDDRVLDVGCGIGRVAIALMRYLSTEGAYRGFDIVKPGIDWCRKEITSRAENFRFEWADVFNATYNPWGTTLAKDFPFPYEDSTFDFVFLTSVFTHMLPEDVSHYTAEVSRVLKPGKLCLMTYFLLNEESRRYRGADVQRLDFSHSLEGCRTTNPTHPEAAVAYEEAAVLDELARCGLSLVRPIRYGRWCGRRAVRFQDVVVARKL